MLDIILCHKIACSKDCSVPCSRAFFGKQKFFRFTACHQCAHAKLVAWKMGCPRRAFSTIISGRLNNVCNESLSPTATTCQLLSPVPTRVPHRNCCQLQEDQPSATSPSVMSRTRLNNPLLLELWTRVNSLLWQVFCVVAPLIAQVHD